MKTKNKSFKRLFAFLVALVMVTALVPSVIFAAEPTFPDVPADYWAYDYIETLAAKKVVGGYADGTFGPKNNVTRQQAAKMIAKAAGLEASEGFVSKFTDFDKVASDMKASVLAVEDNKVVGGFPDGSFGPTKNITRSQAAKMIVLAFGLAKGSNPVDFDDPVADATDQSYIDILASNGIVGGYKEGGKTLYKPANLLTREQLAKMIVEAMELELEIMEVKAVNSKTVEATFNKELSALALKDFSVYEKDDESAINVISKLAKKGAVATLTLTNALEEDTDYILDVDGVGKAEFTYEEAEAASIAFVATTVQTTKDVLYVIKDAAGNDITANYSLADLTVQTSASSVVSNALKATSVGYSVVNVKITDTEIETGNTVIEVKSTLDVLTSVGRWTLKYGTPPVGTLAKPVTELFKSTSGAKFEAEALNQDGEVNAPAATITYKSNSPAVLVVQPDGQTVEPIAAGTASVVITATVGTKSVSRTVQVTVKADPKATTLELEPKSITLVLDSGLTQDVKAKVLDQYGEKFPIDTGITHEFAKNGIATITHAYPEDISTTTFTAVAKGSTTLKITYEVDTVKLTQSVAVTVVEKAAPAGYAVEVKDTTLDLLSESVLDYDDIAKGPKSTTVKVYEIDINGNKTGTASFTLEPTTGSATGKVTYAGGTVTASAKGSQKLDVKVGSTVVETITFTVVDSTRALDNVVQLKNAITVAKDSGALTGKLFGTLDEDEAFVGYDQYGEKILVSGGYEIVSSDLSVVNASHAPVKVGTAKLTVVFGALDLIFTIDVVVTAVP